MYNDSQECLKYVQRGDRREEAEAQFGKLRE